jgi:hypothetical protein
MNIEDYDWSRLAALGYPADFAEKMKGLDGKACWDGYKLAGTKQKGGRTVDDCVPISKSEHSEDTVTELQKGRANPGAKRKQFIFGPAAGSPSFAEEETPEFRSMSAGAGLTIDVECDTNLPLSTPAELREQKMRKRTEAAMQKAKRAQKRTLREQAKEAKRQTQALKRKQNSDFTEREAFAIGYPQQTYDRSEEDFLRDQQTNMPSRGMASTFEESEEEKLKWKRDEITGKLGIVDGKPDEPKAPPKGKTPKALPKGATRPGVSQSSQRAQQAGNALASNKQVNQAGRQAQMKNMQKINSQRVNPG